MAGWPPAKNAAFTWFFFIRDADGDPVASATALDVEVSGDGAVFADVAGTEVDEGEGLYSCPITAGEMNFDAVALICKTSTSGAKTAAQAIYTSTRQLDDLAFPSVSGRNFVVETDGMIHGDIKEWLGVAPSALVSGRVDSSVGAMATDVITAAALSAAGADKAADHLLRRTYANARASSDGDAVAFRSLLGAIGKLVNRWQISGATLTVFQEDDATSTAPGGTQAVTATAGANPITQLDTT